MHIFHRIKVESGCRKQMMEPGRWSKDKSIKGDSIQHAADVHIYSLAHKSRIQFLREHLEAD